MVLFELFASIANIQVIIEPNTFVRLLLFDILLCKQYFFGPKYILCFNLNVSLLGNVHIYACLHFIFTMFIITHFVFIFYSYRWLYRDRIEKPALPTKIPCLNGVSRDRLCTQLRRPDGWSANPDHKNRERKYILIHYSAKT